MQTHRTGMCLAIVIVSALTTAAAADEKASTQPDAIPLAAAARELTLHVVDTRRKPVAGAKVIPWAVSSGSGSFSINDKQSWSIKTDAQGVARIVLPLKGNDPEARSLQEAARAGIRAIALLVDHPDHPLWSAYVDSGWDRRITLLESTTVEVRAHRQNEQGALRRLFPVLTGSLYSGADWSEHGGVLTIRRVDLDGDEATRWLRIVHVPETGPAWFSDLIDLRRVNYPFRLDLALKPGVRVEGSLDERVPRPVKNGRIVAEIIDGTDSWSHWTWLASAKIDPDGKFVLESLPAEENLQLIALCDGWVSSSPTAAEVSAYTAEHGPKELNLNYRGREAIFVWPRLFRLKGPAITALMPMHRTADCEMTVVDEAHRPLRDATVSFSPNQAFFNSGSTILGTGIDALGLMRSQIATGKHALIFDWRDWRPFANVYSAKTNERGNAFVRNLPLPGSNEPTAPVATSFSVSHSAYASRASELRPPDTKVKLLPGGTAHVTVRLHRSTAIPDTISAEILTAPAISPATSNKRPPETKK